MTGAGGLDRSLTIQRRTVSPNAFNELIETWATLATVKVAVRDVSAAEAMRAMEVGAQLSTRFKIRYSSEVATVNPADRILYAGVTYNITAKREVQRGRWLELDAVARIDLPAAEGSP